MRKQRTNVVGDAIIDAYSKRKVRDTHSTLRLRLLSSHLVYSQVVPAPDAPCAVHIYCHRGHGGGRGGRRAGVSDDSSDSDDDAGRRRRRGVTVVQYLDADGLSEFIKTAEKQQDGMQSACVWPDTLARLTRPPPFNSRAAALRCAPRRQRVRHTRDMDAGAVPAGASYEPPWAGRHPGRHPHAAALHHI